jgi:hypothetical protein
VVIHFSKLEFAKMFLELVNEKPSMMDFWVLMPCGFINEYQHFGAFLRD